MRFSHALATRPEPQQAELVEALGSFGLEVVSLPAFRFEAGQGLPDLAAQARGALLVFTSPRAVSFGLAALGGALPVGARAAAIGPATRAELDKRGVVAMQAPGDRHDSEALLAALDGKVPPGRALIFAAPGGREALERGLRGQGWQVSMAHVYRRVPLPPDPVEAGRLDDASRVLSLWTSGTAMRQLLEGLATPARDKVLKGAAIVASARLAALAEVHGFDTVITAAGAANAALLEAVVTCLEGRAP
jgi:uroporphyrinogen-III synthase